MIARRRVVGDVELPHSPEQIAYEREADRVLAFCVSGRGHAWDDRLAEYEPPTRDTPGVSGDAWACTACGHVLYIDHDTGTAHIDGKPFRTELRA